MRLSRLSISASTSRAAAIERVPLSENVLRQYIGGSGLGARLLLDEGGATADPLLARRASRLRLQPAGRQLRSPPPRSSPSSAEPADRAVQRLAREQRLCPGRQSAAAATPSSSLAAPAGCPCCRRSTTARCGWSRRKRSAARTCPATPKRRLRARLGADYRVASIGPAGERAVRYATISHDGRHAGRGGSGAVLGSKNIKAIAVRGTQRCEWAHPRELTELSRDLSERSFGPATAKYRELGTATNLLTFNRFGALPTRNFQTGTFEEAANLSPEQLSVRHATHARELRGVHDRLRAHLLATKSTAWACAWSTRACSRSARSAASATATRCCARRSGATNWGIDTISTGGTIAFAMECVERGLLDEPWLTFGSGEARAAGDRSDRPARRRRAAPGGREPARPRGRSGRAASRLRRR